MRNLIFIRLFVAKSLLAVLVGCVRLDQVESDDSVVPMTRDSFEMQNACSAAWFGLLSEWKESGGGIKDSIELTRRQIEEDSRSILAGAVRSVWSEQKNVDSESLRNIGHWPIEEGRNRHLHLLLLRALIDHVPPDCATTAWLDSRIWDELYQIRNGELIERRLTDAPDFIKWDAFHVVPWVMYWLLVRIE